MSYKKFKVSSEHERGIVLMIFSGIVIMVFVGKVTYSMKFCNFHGSPVFPSEYIFAVFIFTFPEELIAI